MSALNCRSRELTRDGEVEAGQDLVDLGNVGNLGESVAGGINVGSKDGGGSRRLHGEGRLGIIGKDGCKSVTSLTGCELTLGIDTLDDDHTRPLLVLPDVQQMAPQSLILGSRAALNSISKVVRDDDLGLLGDECRGRERVERRRVQVDLGLLRERKRGEE